MARGLVAMAACSVLWAHAEPAPSNAATGRAQAAPTPGAATQTFHGHVSFYGPGFVGRPTANGERFDPNDMTMAHKSLPFGTLVRVTNPQTNHSVVVRVNDRGPYFGNRIADLSQGAAARLRMLGQGVINAKMEIIGMAQRLRDLPPQAAAAAVAVATPVIQSIARAVSPGSASAQADAPQAPAVATSAAAAPGTSGTEVPAVAGTAPAASGAAPVGGTAASAAVPPAAASASAH